jgi:hypothetical protein
MEASLNEWRPVRTLRLVQVQRLLVISAKYCLPLFLYFLELKWSASVFILITSYTGNSLKFRELLLYRWVHNYTGEAEADVSRPADFALCRPWLVLHSLQSAGFFQLRSLISFTISPSNVSHSIQKVSASVALVVCSNMCEEFFLSVLEKSVDVSYSKLCSPSERDRFLISPFTISRHLRDMYYDRLWFRC